MTKHADLIARLEAAEVGSGEFDREIQSAVFGTVWLPYREGAKKTWGFSDHSRERVHVYGFYPATFTTSLDAALALAERLGLDGCELLFNVLNEGEFRVDRLPLALCIAILRALDAQEAAPL